VPVFFACPLSPPPKGREEREIPGHDVVFYILLDTEKKSRWVFTKADGGKINIYSLDEKFKRQLIKLEIKNSSLHTWRHTFLVKSISIILYTSYPVQKWAQFWTQLRILRF
jgi:integrase